MGSSGLVVLLGVFIILALSQTATSIKCYKCNSKTNDGDCGTDFKESDEFKHDCKATDKACYVHTYSEEGVYHTTRSCSILTSICSKIPGMHCTSCTSDYCNMNAITPYPDQS